MREAKDVLVECAGYPISVIIIGIGDADFSNMVELDGDEEILRNSKGVPTKRDIV
jgi:Copine